MSKDGFCQKYLLERLLPVGTAAGCRPLACSLRLVACGLEKKIPKQLPKHGDEKMRLLYPAGITMRAGGLVFISPISLPLRPISAGQGITKLEQKRLCRRDFSNNDRFRYYFSYPVNYIFPNLRLSG
ncbi:MAG: hypothetical protein IAE84_04060 [Saprospiraceae bacterium]|nr:hypothetical protein [Saprospiraceae bacterium]HRD81719.1 hypothetical protein [Saprospiraceae bacterium]